MNLSDSEYIRYSRHLKLSEFGEDNQLKLKNAKVLVIGAGGLGCPVLLYLTAAGIGTIGIVENDIVDESNLQRQILYSSADVGKPKINCAINFLQQQNPHINFIKHQYYINNSNALETIKLYDVIIDGTDNFATRYLVNDACVILNKPLVYGSISKFEGQVSIFNYKNGPTYRCLFPEPPAPENSPNCSDVGVLGVLPGVIGTMQANETIKIITQIGAPLCGRLFIINLLTLENYTLQYVRNEEAATPLSIDEFKEMDYEYFCSGNKTPISEINFSKLSNAIANKAKQLQLIDVRELNELPIINTINDLKIPIKEFEKNIDKIDVTKTIVCFCSEGKRSKTAVQLIKEKHPNAEVYNFSGNVYDLLKLTSNG